MPDPITHSNPGINHLKHIISKFGDGERLLILEEGQMRGRRVTFTKVSLDEVQKDILLLGVVLNAIKRGCFGLMAKGSHDYSKALFGAGAIAKLQLAKRLQPAPPNAFVGPLPPPAMHASKTTHPESIHLELDDISLNPLADKINAMILAALALDEQPVEGKIIEEERTKAHAPHPKATNLSAKQQTVRPQPVARKSTEAAERQNMAFLTKLTRQQEHKRLKASQERLKEEKETKRRKLDHEILKDEIKTENLKADIKSTDIKSTDIKNTDIKKKSRR